MPRLGRNVVILWCMTGLLSAIVSQFALGQAGANSTESPETINPRRIPWAVNTSTPLPQSENEPPANLSSPPDLVGGPDETPPVESHPLDQAIKLLEVCRDRFATVFDYEVRIIQQERIGKYLAPVQDIRAKFRTQPESIYFRWVGPEAGREAIYVEGQDDDKVLVHASGIKRTLLGTSRVDSHEVIAQRESRRSIHEMGIGHLVDTLLIRWEYERQFDATEVKIVHVKVNGRPCFLVTVTHPNPDDGTFKFHTMKIYVDKEHLLPIRSEAYGYPADPGTKPGDLLECSTFLELRLNPGLTDNDFSIANPDYEFSRF